MIFFSAKGLTSSNPGIIRFLAGLEKKVFKISALLASCVKISSPSRNVISSEYFV